MEGLYATAANQWLTVATDPTGLAYSVQVPFGLATQSLTPITTDSLYQDSSQPVARWDGSRLVATWFGGIPNALLLGSTGSGNFNFSLVDVSEGSYSLVGQCQHLYLATSPTRRLVTWDSAFTGTSQVSYALYDDALAKLKAVTVLGAGTDAKAEWVGSQWSVIWNDGTHLVRQFIDASGTALGAPATIATVAEFQKFRVALLPDSRTAITWWDSATNTIQLAVCQ